MLGLFGHQGWIEDVVNSAFQSFLEARHTLRDEASAQAFADRIALNAARDRMRSQRRRTFLDEIFLGAPTWMPLAPTPDVHTRDRDLIRRLNDVMTHLGPRIRLPYLLYHVEGRTVAEIARIEGATEHAIYKRIARARAEIRRRARQDPVLSEWLDEVGARR